MNFGDFSMKRYLSRVLTTLAMIMSVGIQPILIQAQQTTTPPPPPPPAPTVRPQQQRQPTPQASPSPQSRSTSSANSQRNTTRPLSTNEDPAMIGRRNINRGIIAGMSGGMSREVALGRQLAAEIDRQVRFVDDPVITEYVNRVGQNIVLHSDARVPFTIKVIDSDEVNAFALPGGFFYVNRGLILAADNEAELAGVMAHEIAHVTARHAMENQARGMIAEGLLVAGSIFLGGIPAIIAQNTAGLGLLAAFTRFSRDAEREADRLGVQYMYAAGYDPNAMSTMFEKLMAQNRRRPGFLSRAFATHPQTPDRIADTRALVARFPDREEYVITTSEFQRVKARLMRLTNARAATSGAIQGSTDNGSSTPGRPTLRRRQPPAPDGTTPTDNNGQPTNETPGRPTLRRNDGVPPTTAPSPSPSPSSRP
jgi:beta-barrel assembly-enhancing protease